MPTKKWVRDTKLAERYDVHRITPWRWAADEKNPFPKPHKLGPNCVRWDLDEIEAYETALASKNGKAA